MKKIVRYSLALLLAFSSNSCKNWIDVNVNPDYPTNVVASVSSRLPWIQHHYNYGYGAASTRAALITGQITSTTFTGTNGILPAWNPTNVLSTTPYQHWFVGSAANLSDLTKAEAEQAWHYIGAAYTIRAMGFMLMLDWYGEMPIRNHYLLSLIQFTVMVKPFLKDVLPIWTKHWSTFRKPNLQELLLCQKAIAGTVGMYRNGPN